MCSIKCAICKAEFNALPYSGEYVKYTDEKHYCVECLVAKRTNSRTKKDKWRTEEVPQKLAILRKNTQTIIVEAEEKERLCLYLERRYSPSYIPEKFYAKLASIIAGTYKGLKRPVPASDLLEMLRQKESYLDRVAAHKWSTTPPMPMDRINWDIAVVLSRYDSFLNWKKEQEIQKAEEEKEIQRIKERRNKPTVTPRIIPEDKENKVDIAAMIDELFD